MTKSVFLQTYGCQTGAVLQTGRGDIGQSRYCGAGRSVFRILIIALVASAGCQAKSELARFQSLCETTGGVFLNCEAAFAAACSRPERIEGMNVVCSCRDEKAWDADRGCR